MNTTEANETGWRQINSDEAWSLCESVGKAAPYPGYMIPVGNKLVRCTRDKLGTWFEVQIGTLSNQV